jgi:hypothetical protein
MRKDAMPCVDLNERNDEAAVSTLDDLLEAASGKPAKRAALPGARRRLDTTCTSKEVLGAEHPHSNVKGDDGEPVGDPLRF